MINDTTNPAIDTTQMGGNDPATAPINPAAGNIYDPTTGQSLNPALQKQLNPGPSTPMSDAQKAAIGKNAAAMQQAISSPFQQGLSNPFAPKDNDPYNTIFGHASNPNPSSNIMPGASSSAPQSGISVGNLAPVAMAPQLQTPGVQLPTVSDIRAKTNIAPAARDINTFLTALYKIGL